jgi:ATPase complex subunit ATP10
MNNGLEMRKHGGKMYYASTQLIKPEKTGYMPNFEAQDLNRKKINTTEKLVGKITLMTFVYAKFGEVMCLFFFLIFCLLQLT